MVLTIIIINCSLALLNCYLIWKIYRIKVFLFHFNELMYKLNNNLVLSLKENHLLILTTALEVRKFNQNYQKLKNKQKTIQKIILFINLIYRFRKVTV